jgi:GH35 family endo-1,4-beta-xylanase
MAANLLGFGGWFSAGKSVKTAAIKARRVNRCLRGFESLEVRCYLSSNSVAAEVWLPLDEGSGNVAADYSGNARNATIFGASFTIGRSGLGLSFNGQSNYVNANLDLSRWLGGTGALSFWLLTTQSGSDSFSQAPGIAGVQQPGSSNTIGWGWLDSKGHIHVGAGTTATSAHAVNDGHWHFIVMTRDATTGREQVFVDGVLDGSAVGRTGGITASFTGIGRIENGAGPTNYFAGKLDDIQIYSQTLTAAQVKKMFKNGPAAHAISPPAPAVSKDAWTQTENARIDQIREGNAEVHVVDQFGNPVANVTIDAREVQSQFPFGSAINANVLSNPQYAAFFQSHFSWAAMEDESTWYFNEPTQGNVTYAVADAIASFAAANNITLRGPALFWGDPNIIQPWLKQLSPADLLAAVESRLQSAVTHFDGTFAQWTVDNEMLHTHFFDSLLGASILPWMFQQVRALDPDVQLFVNDYNTIEGNDTAAYKAEIQSLISQGAPIDGIGVQGHFPGSINAKDVESRLNSLGQLGLPIWITEFDTVNSDPKKRADQMETLYREAFSNPNVDGILMWGFWAGSQWRGPNASMVNLDWTLNADGQRYEDLMHEWTTVADGATNGGGNLDFLGFAGSYEVTVTGPDGQMTTGTFTVNPGTGTSQITIAINLTAPAAATKVVATGGVGRVSLSWGAVSGASSYSILRGTTAGGEASVPIQTGVVGTIFVDTNVVAGTTYYYQIVAVNSAGTSPASAEAAATPLLPTTSPSLFATGLGKLKADKSKQYSGVIANFTSGNYNTAASFSIQVNWGDGKKSAAQAVWNPTTHRWDVVATHKYSNYGAFYLTIIIVDPRGTKATAKTWIYSLP